MPSYELAICVVGEGGHSEQENYEKAFVSKLSDSESEAAETQVWLEFAVQCGYMRRDDAKPLYQPYNATLRTLVGMINHSETWLISEQDKTIREEEEAYDELF